MKIAGEIITSRQNRRVVEVGKLADRKAREATKTFRFDGIKLLIEAVKYGVELESVFLRQSDADRVAERILDAVGDAFSFENVPVFVLADGVFEKISEEKSPEGVISVAKYIDKLQKIVTIYNSENFLPTDKERIVLLESVRDPSNVGAIIRSAAALGVDRLIMSADCADIYHPKAVRASMGAVFNQRIDRVGSLADAIAALQSKGRCVYAAALDDGAVRLGDFEIRQTDCVVIGNEGHGLSESVMNACDKKVFIPMTARAESFNAAVAASLLMWEFTR